MRASSESPKTLRATDAGVIDKNVNAAEPTQRLGRNRLARVAIGNAFDQVRLTEPPGRRFHIGVDIDQQRTGPFRRQDVPRSPLQFPVLRQ